MSARWLIRTAVCSICLYACINTARADEKVVTAVNLPGASLDQEVTYHPSKAEYEAARDEVLKRLKAGDNTAFVNPADGPWMIVETTATIGLEYKGVGASQGRKHLRQVSAAEDALYLFNH
ncbi:hypothetical protein HFO91_30605 [Rhizobium leguminosarum]|uniref:hypothetical protein n=1 Tax=Rhizobium leguminosarum TaxID=384 RepID=UPI001C965329|nr:hypothetical protein [Rhizobium leguminosarum]MBY5453932.1 hypothetical protein [Rhizobium leguminosarum]